jgi:DNA-binding MarR family transcriptional regulator
MLALKGARLESLRKAMIKARSSQRQQQYFYGVANARYILRKIFRLVEDEAKRFGIDPLAHQALIQIYGSPDGKLKIKDVAERLDISPAFSSSLLKNLAGTGYVKSSADKSDKRISWVSVTGKGQDLLRKIDERVNVHVEYFTGNIGSAETEAAVSILLFYAGASLRPG